MKDYGYWQHIADKFNHPDPSDVVHLQLFIDLLDGINRQELRLVTAKRETCAVCGTELTPQNLHLCADCQAL